MVRLMKKNKELLLYGIFGAGATIINVVAFAFFRTYFNLVVSNILAWVFAFIFAFITNKVFVFGSKEWSAKKAIKESIGFTIARLGTLVLDMALMVFLIDTLRLNDTFSKVLVNIIVIIVNYVLSKFFIFKKEL